MNFVNCRNSYQLFSFLVSCVCLSSFVNCDEEVCGDLPDIPHATLSLEGKEPPFHPGVKIRIVCDSGYVSGGRMLQLKCIESEGLAVWDIPEQGCTPRSCGFPGDVENAERTGDVFSFPNSVTYTCKKGYKLKGRATRHCMPSGNWEPSPPSCEGPFGEITPPPSTVPPPPSTVPPLVKGGTSSPGHGNGVKPTPTTVIVGIILIAVGRGISYFYY